MYIKCYICCCLAILGMDTVLPNFIKAARKNAGLTQTELAEKAGVGIHFVRDIEQGKPNLQVNKVNQVLALFGYRLGPVQITTPLPPPKLGGGAEERGGGGKKKSYAR